MSQPPTKWRPPRETARRAPRLDGVTREFNHMADRLREADRTLRAETARALALEENARQPATPTVAGKLAAGLAHAGGQHHSGRAEFVLRNLPKTIPP